MASSRLGRAGWCVLDRWVDAGGAERGMEGVCQDRGPCVQPQSMLIRPVRGQEQAWSRSDTLR